MQSSELPEEEKLFWKGKRSKKKPYKIEWWSDWAEEWVSWASYETLEDRNKALTAIQRKSKLEYRIKNEETL